MDSIWHMDCRQDILIFKMDWGNKASFDFRYRYFKYWCLFLNFFLLFLPSVFKHAHILKSTNFPHYLQIPLSSIVFPNSVPATSFQNSTWRLVQSWQLANISNQKDAAFKRHKGRGTDENVSRRVSFLHNGMMFCRTLFRDRKAWKFSISQLMKTIKCKF